MFDGSRAPIADRSWPGVCKVTAPHPMNSPQRTILIVEPDFALRCIAQRALRPHDVIGAPTLETAERILERVRVDVVVFDPAAEDPDAFDFLVSLATRNPPVRVVVYTLSSEAERRTAFGTAHAILRKPAPDERLREAVLGAADTREFRVIRQT
jgi:DNA-binding NtrC family response regulator